MWQKLCEHQNGAKFLGEHQNGMVNAIKEIEWSNLHVATIYQ
jgi:hypothetical protein